MIFLVHLQNEPNLPNNMGGPPPADEGYYNGQGGMGRGGLAPRGAPRGASAPRGGLLTSPSGRGMAR